MEVNRDVFPKSAHVIQKIKGSLIVSKAEDSVLVMKMLMLRIVQNDLNLLTVSVTQNVAFYCKTKKGVWNPNITK